MLEIIHFCVVQASKIQGVEKHEKKIHNMCWYETIENL